MNRAVEIENLQKSFSLIRWKGFRRQIVKVPAVDGITLSVAAGESVAVIGPNGAGKSTTIKILTGILHPSGGRVNVLGYTPWRERQQLARHIGAVFGQRSQLWYHLPPGDTFELLARVYDIPRPEFVQTRDGLIERFGLGPFLEVPVRKLSLGQRMRAEVAASLLHRPRIIFLDEPTIGLDVVARQELRNLVRQWNRNEGVTVFLTSHDTGDIEHVADRVVVINHGRVVLDDSIAAMRRQFLTSKIVKVQFLERPPELNIDGVVQSDRGYEASLAVDTSVRPVAQVIATVLQAAPVADISIEDPPLDSMIAAIYSKSPEQGRAT